MLLTFKVSVCVAWGGDKVQLTLPDPVEAIEPGARTPLKRLRQPAGRRTYDSGLHVKVVSDIRRRALSGTHRWTVVGVVLVLLAILTWTVTAEVAVGAATAGAAARATGCPSGSPAPPAGEHCVSVPATVMLMTHSTNDSCGQITFMQEPLNDEIGEYFASYTPPGGGSPELFSSATGGPYPIQQWSTKEVSYAGLVYKVPRGDGAWFVGYGGGAGPCTSDAKGSATGWGITSHPVLSGTVRLGCSGACSANGLPVADVTVDVRGPTSASVSTGDDGGYSVLVKRAYDVTPSASGWKFDPDHQSVDVHSSVAGVDFTGCPGAAAGASAAAGSVWSLVGRSPTRSGFPCLNRVHVTYNPASGQMAVGWFTTAAVCDTRGPATTSRRRRHRRHEHSRWDGGSRRGGHIFGRRRHREHQRQRSASDDRQTEPRGHRRHRRAVRASVPRDAPQRQLRRSCLSAGIETVTLKPGS